MTKIQHLCMILSVLAISGSVWSMEAMPIEEIYAKYNQSTTQPDAAAIQVINDFWKKSIDAIMLSEDSEKIVSLRQELKKYRGSDHLSLYSSAYLKVAREHLSEAIETVEKWEQVTQKQMVERNIIILIADLGRAGLADLVLPKLSSKDPMVRYWAVRSLTSRDIIEQSKPDAVTRDDKRTSDIIAALDEYLKTTPDAITLPLAANFAAGIQTAASVKLLAGMADRRIDAYMKWTVTDEPVDAEILKSMGNMAMQVSNPAEKQELMSRFGQLYACVLGRYMQTEKTSRVARDQLVTVIVEVEDKIISKQISGWAKFRTNISKNIPLADDYNLLFGQEGRAGELATKMNFNYGKDSFGKPLVWPKPLPPVPQPSVETKAPAVEKAPVVEKAPAAETEPPAPAANP